MQSAAPPFIVDRRGAARAFLLGPSCAPFRFQQPGNHDELEKFVQSDRMAGIDSDRVPVLL